MTRLAQRLKVVLVPEQLSAAAMGFDVIAYKLRGVALNATASLHPTSEEITKEDRLPQPLPSGRLVPGPPRRTTFHAMLTAHCSKGSNRVKPDTSHWPPTVHPVTFDDIGKLGVDSRDNALFWNGQAVEIRKRLANFERFMAAIGAGSALIIAAIEIGRSIGWWGG